MDCMNGTCEKYLKKEKKKRENKERSQHALILKTLNNFINQLHLFSEYIEHICARAHTHTHIYKDSFFAVIVLGILI